MRNEHASTTPDTQPSPKVRERGADEVAMLRAASLTFRALLRQWRYESGGARYMAGRTGLPPGFRAPPHQLSAKLYYAERRASRPPSIAEHQRVQRESAGRWPWRIERGRSTTRRTLSHADEGIGEFRSLYRHRLDSLMRGLSHYRLLFEGFVDARVLVERSSRMTWRGEYR